MPESVARLWEATLRGDPSTDNVVLLITLAAIGCGWGALILWDEARRRGRS